MGPKEVHYQHLVIGICILFQLSIVFAETLGVKMVYMHFCQFGNQIIPVITIKYVELMSEIFVSLHMLVTSSVRVVYDQSRVTTHKCSFSKGLNILNP